MPSNAPASNYAFQNFDQLTAYVKGKLGGNLIDVELTSDDYKNAFYSAKATWFQRGNVNLNECFTRFNMITGQTVYDFSQNNVALDNILELIRPTSSFYTQNPFTIGVFEELFRGILSQATSDIWTYVGTLQFISEIDMIMIADPDFIWNRRTQTLTVLKTPVTNGTWFARGYSFPADVDLYNLIWIQLWMTMECKNMLGMAYSKFSTIASPAGDVSLNGAALIEAAAEEKKQLLDDIGDYVDADPASGYIGIL